MFGHTFILALQTANSSLDASNMGDTSSLKQKIPKKINKIVLMNLTVRKRQIWLYFQQFSYLDVEASLNRGCKNGITDNGYLCIYNTTAKQLPPILFRTPGGMLNRAKGKKGDHSPKKGRGKKLNREKGVDGDYTSNPWQTTLLGLGRGFSASQVFAFAA